MNCIGLPFTTLQRRQWLNSALVDLTVSPVERMKECLRTLTSPSVTEKKMMEALEEVIEWCENLDFAAGLYLQKGVFQIRS
jgi:hypothetical protein